MTKKQFDKIISASALRQTQLLDEAEGEIIPSEVFDAKMKQRLRETLKYPNRKRTAMVATFTALFIGILSATCYANATHLDLFEAFHRAFSITSVQKQSWDTDFNAKILPSVSNVYLPTWIPNGFTSISSSQSNTGNCVITYAISADKTQFVRLSQKKIHTTSIEDIDVSNFQKIILDHQIYYYGEKNISGKTQNNLVFLQNDRYIYLISTLSKDDLLKVAQSLEFKS